MSVLWYIRQDKLDELVEEFGGDLTRRRLDPYLCAEWEVPDLFEEDVTERYGSFLIGGLEYPAGRILRATDPIAFRVYASEEYSEIDLYEYPEGEG